VTRDTVSTTNLDGTKALKTLEFILPRMVQLTGEVSGKLAKLKISFDLNFIRTYTAEKNDENDNNSSNDGDDDDNATLPVVVFQNLLGNIDDDDSIYQLISLAVPWFEETINTEGSSTKICETM